MRLVELLRKSYRLRDQLRLGYRLFLYLPSIFGLAALFPVYFHLGNCVARALGLGDREPVRGHPMEHWFFAALAVISLAYILVGVSLGALAVALVLRLRGWTWLRIRRLLIESEAPAHWLGRGDQRSSSNG